MWPYCNHPGKPAEHLPPPPATTTTCGCHCTQRPRKCGTCEVGIWIHLKNHFGVMNIISDKIGLENFSWSLYIYMFFFFILYLTQSVMRKFAYCKVVLATSLIWLLLDMFLLLYFSKCNKCDFNKKRERASFWGCSRTSTKASWRSWKMGKLVIIPKCLKSMIFISWQVRWLYSTDLYQTLG